MRFTIQQSELNAAIATVQKALRAGSPNPMLDGIFVEAKGAGVRLMCSDTTLQIEAMCSAQVEDEGAMVLPGRLFGDLIRRIPDGDVTLSAIEEDARLAMQITAKSIKTRLQGLSADNYPEMPPQPKAISVKLPGKLLKDMIRQTRFAASLDESRPVLMGVLFEAADKLKMVAIDGYRMAIREESANIEGRGDMVVPSSSLREIAATLLDSEDEVTVEFSDSTCVIDMGNVRINSVLLSGEYMKYDNIIPKEHLTRMRVNRRELLAAIERASLMAMETRNNLVKFVLSGERLTISADSELGSVVDELSVQQIGGDIEIAFNAKYVTEVLKALDDEELYFDFNNNISPCVVKDVDGGKYLYLILPVRLFSN